jgi:hypothetical protein
MYTRSPAAVGTRLTSQQVIIRPERNGYRSSYRPGVHKRRSHRGRYIVAAIICALLLSTLSLTQHSDAAISELRSGVDGYCMDAYQNGTTPDTIVDSWKCNSSAAQDWAIAQGAITHDTKYCLSVANNTKGKDSKIVVNLCDQAPGQVWFSEKGGYLNPNSGLCLSASSKPDTQLFLDSCTGLGSKTEAWSSASSKPGTTAPNVSCKSGSEGERVACIAEQQWALWQLAPSSRPQMLNNYSNGNGYEEWCADFVSYVYMTAGHPFSGGEREGWDEYNANNIQYQGFTKHWAGSYIPKTGDIGFFDYPGGHVEIVASGGKTPTFIYGDSATTDPVTGNGDMATNTLTSDGSLGQIQYYLSPN